MSARTVLVPAVGLLMLGAGVFLTGLTDAVAVALIVVGAGMFVVGILLPALTEFEIGPGGFSAKLRERDEEVRAALEPDAEQLARLALWLSGERDAGKELAERALAETYVRWPEARRAGPARAARRRLVELAGEATAGFGAGEAPAAGVEPSAERLLGQVASLPADERSALVLRLLDGMGPGEIAETLGRTPGTVEGELERGGSRLAGVAGTAGGPG
jgi:hypothetical protein